MLDIISDAKASKGKERQSERLTDTKKEPDTGSLVNGSKTEI